MRVKIMIPNFYIVFILFLTFSSLKIFEVSAVESPFQVYCNEDASQEYKAYFSTPRLPEKKVIQKLVEFTLKGEKDAFHTVYNLYNNAESNGVVTQSKEVFLRTVATPQNGFVFPFLARHLDDAHNPECLIWYQKCNDNYVADPDSITNYAMAILIYSQPSIVVTDKALALLQKWDREHMTSSKQDMLTFVAVYQLIFKSAKKLQYTDLIIKHVNWKHRFPAVMEGVRKTFIEVFEGTPYINLIIKETGLVPILIKPEDLFTPENIMKIALKIVSRHQEYDKNVVSSVVHKLSDILKDKNAREAPHRKYKDFKPTQATREQITFWARDIIITRRAQLVEYTGDDVMLRQLFSEIDNVTLEKYLISAFKEMFCLEF